MKITTTYLLLIIPLFLTGQSELIPQQQDSLWAYIDINTQKVIVPYQYDEATEFDIYGYAKVRKGDLWGILDEDGNQVLEVSYDALTWQLPKYHDPEIRPYLLTQRNGLFGMMDTELKEIIPNDYEAIYFFHKRFFKDKPSNKTKDKEEDFAKYFKVKKNGKLGLVDEQNKLILPFEYDDIEAVPHHKINYDYDPDKNLFDVYITSSNYHPRKTELISNDIFLAKKENQYQLVKLGGKAITQDGNYKRPMIYTYSSSDKKDEMIILSKHNQKGVISTNGEVLIPFEYSKIQPLIGNYLKIVKETEILNWVNRKKEIYGIANIEGEIIQAAIYQQLNGQLFRNDSHWGVFTKDFQDFLVPPQYDKIEAIKNNPRQVLVSKNHKTGVLDTEKGMLIPTEYDFIDASLGLNYIAKKKGKWGIIDTNFNVVIPFQHTVSPMIPTFSYVHPGPPVYNLIFQEDDKYGIMNRQTLEWLITPQYDSIDATNSNNIYVQLDDKWGKVNMDNEILIPIEYDEIKANHHVRKGDKWGLLSRNYKILLEPIYDEIVNKNYARIGTEWLVISKDKSTVLSEEYNSINGSGDSYYSEKNNKKGLIEIRDSLHIIPPQYEEMYIDASNVLIVKKDNKWGMADKNNNILIPLNYERILKLGEYKKERWKVYNGEHWAFYGRDGKQIMPFIFSDIREYKKQGRYPIDGIKSTFYIVKQGELSGLITENGEWILPCEFQNFIGKFRNSNHPQSTPLFPVQKSKKWGYAKQGGQIVLPFQYTTASPFDNNIATVSYGEDHFSINESGQRITNENYTYMSTPHSELALIIVQNKAGFFGAINKSDEVIIPLIYDERPDNFCTHFYAVAKNGLYGIVHSSGKIIHECSLKQKPSRYSNGLIYSGRNQINLSPLQLEEGTYSPFDFQVTKQFYKNYYYIKKDDYFGLLDINTNTVIVPCEYDQLYTSSRKNPMAFILAAKGRNTLRGTSYELIDSTARVIISNDFDQINVNENKNRIICTKKNKQCIYDLEGQKIAEFNFDNFHYRGQGPYAALLDDKWGYIDINGKTVIPFQFSKAGYFSNIYFNSQTYFKSAKLANNSGLAVDTIMVAEVSIGGNKRYINRNGVFLGDKPTSKGRSYISSGLTKIQQDSSKKYGIVDNAGKVVVPFEYSSMCNKNKNYIILYKGAQKAYFYIDNREISPLYQDIEGKGYDQQWVYNGTHYGFVDKYGETLSPIHFDYIKRTEDDLFTVRKGDKFGFFNKDIEQVIPFIYDAIPCTHNSGSYQFKLGNTLAFKDNKYGIINTKGEALIPFEYDAIQYYDHYQAMGFRDGEWELLEFIVD